MPVSVDPHSRIIEVTKSPVDGVVQIDVRIEFFSVLKDLWRITPELQGMRFPLRPVGGDPIGDSIVGPFVFVDNSRGWRIRPFDADHELTLRGNLFPENPLLPLWDMPSRTIAIFGERSAQAQTILVEQLEVQHASFAGGVHVDTASPWGGTTFPTGTPRQPVNNIVDALAIANIRGLRIFYLYSGVVINTGLDFSNRQFVGATSSLTLAEVAAEADVQGCSFSNVVIRGVFNGTPRIRDCVVLDVTIPGGSLVDSSIRGTVRLSSPSPLHVVNCRDGFHDELYPIVDFQGFPGDVGIHGWRGQLGFRNKSDASVVGIDIDTGQVILEPTVTNGTFLIRGVADLVDESTGSTSVESAGLLNPGSTWETAAGQSVVLATQQGFGADDRTLLEGAADGSFTTSDREALLETRVASLESLVQSLTARKALTNRQEVNSAAQRLVLYDDDGETVLYQWPISSVGGAPVQVPPGATVKRDKPL